MTHGIQQVLVIRLTVRQWLASRLQHFNHCKFPPLFFQLEQAILVYLQDFFIKAADVQTYVRLHTFQQQHQEKHVSKPVRSEAEAVTFVRVNSFGDAGMCFLTGQDLSYLGKNLFSAPYLMGPYSINQTVFCVGKLLHQ